MITPSVRCLVSTRAWETAQSTQMMVSNSRLRFLLISFSSHLTTGTVTCATGSYGVLCGICTPSFTHSNDGRCVSCVTDARQFLSNGWVLSILGLLCVIGFLVACSSIAVFVKYNKRINEVMSLLSPKFKITSSFFQITLLVQIRSHLTIHDSELLIVVLWYCRYHQSTTYSGQSNSCSSSRSLPFLNSTSSHSSKCRVSSSLMPTMRSTVLAPFFL